MLFASWPWRRPRVGLAFTERFLLAHRAGTEARTVRREVPVGLVAPSKLTPNIQSVKDVARLAAEMLDELDARRLAVSLALPDLAVVTTFGPSSNRSNRDVRSDEARLGFPEAEARRDFWQGRKGEVLGAAVREAVVRQYEQVVEAAECTTGWVDSASLVRVPAWAESSQAEPSLTVRVQLHASHYVLAAFRSGELVDIRTRLRSAGDSARVAEEVSRVPAVYGVDSLGSVVISGESAEACAKIVGDLVTGAVSVSEDSEEGQVAAVLVELLSRGRT